jgi:hypothetical protein
MECSRRELLTARFVRNSRGGGTALQAPVASAVEIGPLSSFPIGVKVPVNGARQIVIADEYGLRAMDNLTLLAAAPASDAGAPAEEPLTRPLYINSRGQVCLDTSQTCPPAAYLNLMTGELCYAQEDQP